MKEICTALNKAQASLKKAVKDSTNPHFKSRYADLESVLDAMREPFAENGLSVTQSVVIVEGSQYMQTTIWHVSGESIASKVPFILTKQDSQGIGSSLTYARRYGLAAAAAISQTDDDAEAAVGRPVAPKPVLKPQPYSFVQPKESIETPFNYESHRALVVDAAKELGITNDYLKEHRENLIKFLNDYASATLDSVKLALTSYMGAKQ
jgi:hypothetical protein